MDLKDVSFDVERVQADRGFTLSVKASVSRACMETVGEADLRKLMEPALKCKLDEELEREQRPFNFRFAPSFAAMNDFDTNTCHLMMACRGEYTDEVAA